LFYRDLLRFLDFLDVSSGQISIAFTAVGGSLGISNQFFRLLVQLKLFYSNNNKTPWDTPSIYKRSAKFDSAHVLFAKYFTRDSLKALAFKKRFSVAHPQKKQTNLRKNAKPSCQQSKLTLHVVTGQSSGARATEIDGSLSV
jgi:hypothetical protein